MEITHVIAGAASAIVVTALVVVTISRPVSIRWHLPALISALFLVYSVWVVIVEGPLGFWTVHTDGLWGTQVWIDLLLAVGCVWILMLPMMRDADMRLVPWLLLVCCSGCIGLFAALARAMYLRENALNEQTPANRRA